MSIESSPLRDRMIFVVGARRSGTNWIGRIITSHPDVDGVRSESYLFSLGLSQLMRRFQHASKGSWQIGSIYMERPVLIDALRDFCDTVFMSVLADNVKGASRLVERTPHHSRELSLIGEIYPDAHVVHIVRDGRAVVRSLLKMGWGPESVEDAVIEWRDSVTAGRRDGAALPHYHEVRYEALLGGDTSELITSLFTALDLEVNDDIIHRAVAEAAEEYNVDHTSPGVSASKWRAELSAEQLEMIDRIAGPLLAELDYTDQIPRAAPTPPGSRPRPWVEGTRAVARRGRALAGHLRTRSDVPASPGHPMLLQEIVDRFLGAVRTGNRSDALSLVLTPPKVRVVTPSQKWDERSSSAGERLVDLLLADPAIAGTQIHCDVWPSLDAYTVVLTSDAGGVIQHRTLWFHVTERGIDQAAFYAVEEA